MKFIFERGSWIIASLGIVCSASASTGLDNVSDSLYQALGQSYTSVGQINGDGGTLIDSHWVLTAAHVLGNGQTGSFTIGGQSYSYTNSYQDPLWDGNVADGNDFSLAYIGGSGVTLGGTGASLVTTSSYFSGTVANGTLVTSVGFGLGGNGLTGDTGAGAKRGFTNIIDAKDPNDAVLGDLKGYVTDFDSPDGSGNTLGYLGSSATPTSLEGNLAPGDSGGGLFASIGGHQVLIGVNSYIGGDLSTATSSYGWISGFAATPDGSNWIASISGVQPVPEPSMLLLAALIVPFALRKRR